MLEYLVDDGEIFALRSSHWIVICLSCEQGVYPCHISFVLRLDNGMQGIGASVL